MQVGELSETLAKRQESRLVVKMGDLEVSNDASTLTVGGDDSVQRFLLDKQALAVVSKYLKIPTAYVDECPPDFRAQTLNFWLHRKPDVEIMLESVNGGLAAAYQPGLNLLPVKEVGKVVERIFNPEDEIRNFARSEERFQLDVTSDRFKVDILNPNRIPGRPEVGDITEAGVRFLMTPNKVKAPSAARLFHRLWCSNGACAPEASGRIAISGLTVPEILASMEEAAQRILGTMDDALQAYARTAETGIPGHPVSFAEQLGHQAGLSHGVIHSVLEQVRQLPTEHATVYDITQAFTSVANDVSSTATRHRLQALGGNLVLNTTKMIERCTQCEQLLVNA